MTLLEIKDKKAVIEDKTDAIIAKAEVELRGLTSVELDEINKNNDEIEVLLTLARAAGYKDNKGVVVRSAAPAAAPKPQFSLLKAIRDRVENRTADEATKDVTAMGRTQFRGSGVSAAGDIVIPEFRASIAAQTSLATGEAIIQQDKKAILPPLVDKLVFAQAGATFLGGLVGDVSIPSYSGTSVAWKGENAAADPGEGTFGEVNLSPKRLTAYILVSKLFLAQDGVGAEALLMENIASAVARKLEATILGVAAGSATQPQGMGYKCTTGTDTKVAASAPTHALMVGLETAVDTSNALIGNLAYITNGAGRGILKSTVKVANEPIYLLENGQMNGYPVYVTNACSTDAGTDTKELLVFGNWADLVIAQWGGYDITVDPYSAAATNQVKIVINSFFDAKGLRGTASTGIGTDADDYAKSFASMPIK